MHAPHPHPTHMPKHTGRHAPEGEPIVLSTGSISATALTRRSLAATSTLNFPPRECPASRMLLGSTCGFTRGSWMHKSIMALHVSACMK